MLKNYTKDKRWSAPNFLPFLIPVCNAEAYFWCPVDPPARVEVYLAHTNTGVDWVPGRLEAHTSVDWVGNSCVSTSWQWPLNSSWYHHRWHYQYKRWGLHTSGRVEADTSGDCIGKQLRLYHPLAVATSIIHHHWLRWPDRLVQILWMFIDY